MSNLSMFMLSFEVWVTGTEAVGGGGGGGGGGGAAWVKVTANLECYRGRR